MKVAKLIDEMGAPIRAPEPTSGSVLLDARTGEDQA